ncbi:TonB-dependent receptor [Rhodohalobacter sp. 614A]|uniref:TonB-dependent receptor n=1 Tax=Rhodohalobacter sp. 614A TaxID=2908649 RepID=UPI001F33673E|nr:TonB-dependent receptor [Rhodohalobacter sp. 614A]
MKILKEKNQLVLLVFILLVIRPVTVQAQSVQTVQGKITDETGTPLENVNVGIEGTRKGNITDQNGEYSITGLETGDYTIVASSVGYQTQKKSVTVRRNEETVVNFTLIEEISALGDITVSAESDATRRSREPITITAIDAASLNTQAIGAEDILKRATGVLVRQEGGLGSRSSINLNGLTGNAVRVYYDGIPIDLYGEGIQLNNLPVNSIERVEVYKGVMPITVGTDALGGGINIIPKTFGYNFLQASYEYGSFNTHRATIAGRKEVGENISLSGNMFLNHSDNTYGMENIPNQTIRIFENDFGRMDTTVVENRTDVKRFNSQHTSAYFEGGFSVSNQSWADELTLSTAYSTRYDEFQHGQRVTKRPAGEAHKDVQSFIERIRYRKAFGSQIQVEYFGMVSLTKSMVDDSTSNLYDWNGDIMPITNNRGAEILSRPSLRDGDQTGTAHRLTFQIDLHPRHSVALSNFFGYSRIEGKDPVGNRLNLAGEMLDPNTIPSHYKRNISGAELQSLWLKNDRLTTTVFYKNYYYNARSIDINQVSSTIIPIRENNSLDHGYGMAVKMDIHSNLFVRSSFERTIRMPDETEIYGDFLSIVPNYTILPERSQNLNIGLFYQKEYSGGRFYSVDVNGFLRRQENLVRLRPRGFGEESQYMNEDEVSARGLELAVKSNPVQNLSVQANVTYQKIELTSANTVQEESFVGVQVPNIPDFFFNTSWAYRFTELFRNQGFLELFWNYYFVDQFSITYVPDKSNANRENLVPTQHQHNFGITYAPRQSLSFSFQANNVFDNTVYDNYRVPKPGLNASLKINYSIN